MEEFAMRLAKIACLAAVCCLIGAGLFAVSHRSCSVPARAKATGAPRVKAKAPVPPPPQGGEKAPPAHDFKAAEAKAPPPPAVPPAAAKAPPAEQQAPPKVVEVPAPDPLLRPNPDKPKPAEPKGPPWTVVGRGADQQDADDAALQKARDKLIAYLRGQDPPLEWQPSDEYVDKNLVKEREPVKELEGLVPDSKVYERTLKVDVDPKHFREMVDMDRRERVGERQLLLARILGGIVALLVAVFGYFRLEELTKGYYTGWLRVGAVLLVAAVGVTLLLIG
jgi:hypothetical protein